MGTLRDQLAKQMGLSAEELEARDAADKKQTKVTMRNAAEQEAATKHSRQCGHYFDADYLCLSEARELLATLPSPPANPKVDGMFDPETFTLPSVQCIRGSLTVDDFTLPADGANLIVQGSLTVHGILKQDFRAGGLLVSGDLTAGHIVTTGEIACLGNLCVDGTLYGNCTNYSTNVWGKAIVGTVVSAKEHYAAFEPNVPNTTTPALSVSE